MNKYTPAPWTMTEEFGVEPLASDGNPIMSFKRPHDELMANARLIVAAPELLEALIELFDEVGDAVNDSDGMRLVDQELHTKVREAIIKATEA
jgi:hypothetical protein